MGPLGVPRRSRPLVKKGVTGKKKRFPIPELAIVLTDEQEYTVYTGTEILKQGLT